jgi:hypothetical protein
MSGIVSSTSCAARRHCTQSSANLGVHFRVSEQAPKSCLSRASGNVPRRKGRCGIDHATSRAHVELEHAIPCTHSMKVGRW